MNAKFYVFIVFLMMQSAVFCMVIADNPAARLKRELKILRFQIASRFLPKCLLKAARLGSCCRSLQKERERLAALSFCRELDEQDRVRIREIKNELRSIAR